MKNSFVVNGLNREQAELVESALEMMMASFTISKDDSLRLMLTQGALQANRCALREDTIFNKEILKLIAQAKGKNAAKRARKMTVIEGFKVKKQKRKEVKQEMQNE